MKSRRELKTRFALTARALPALVIVPLVAWVVPGEAATIYANGACSLAEAITSANIDGKADIFCIAGNGADTIVLQYDVSLSSSDNTLNGENGLPVITSEITIESDERPRTVERAAGAGDFRIFYVDAPDGDLTLRNLRVRIGKQPGGAGGCARVRGGASLRIENSTFSGCAANHGGAVWVGTFGSLQIEGSTFEGNWTFGEGCYGGAVSVFQVPLSIYGSTFLQNWAFCADGLGGALSIRCNETIIANTTFSQNLAGEKGGAIWSGSLFGEPGATVWVGHSTFSGNNFGAEGEGSSLAIEGDSSGRLVASIVDDSPASDCAGMIIDYGSNFGCGNPDVTNLDSLAQNGGPTETHALLEGSNAIDVVTDCSFPLDQRGAFREDGFCDSGSFEYYGCQEWRWGNEVIDGRIGFVGPSPCRIIIGPDWSVIDGGIVDIFAGREVIFLDDSWVEEGGEVSVTVDPDFLVP